MTSIHRSKSNARTLFAQILDLIPLSLLQSCINQTDANKGFRTYCTRTQLISMLFGQLNSCYSLRDINLGMNVNKLFLKELNLKQSPSRSTMSDGNAKRNYRVYELLFSKLVKHYKHCFAHTEKYRIIEGIEGKSVKIIDATTMTVCLSLIQWASFRTAKGGIKAHVSFDMATQIPEVVYISDARLDDRKGLSHLNLGHDNILVYDRGYFDFAFFKNRISNHADFVTRLKSKIRYDVVRQLPVPSDHPEIISDKLIVIKGEKARTTQLDKETLRLVVVFDEVNQQYLQILTANLNWPATTISALYKCRWDIELFFKGIKQNLQIKTFIGTSQNACKSQIYIAMITYLLLEIIRRCISKAKHGFSNLVNLIRICLMHYHSLRYIVNDIRAITQKLQRRPPTRTQLNLRV